MAMMMKLGLEPLRPAGRMIDTKHVGHFDRVAACVFVRQARKNQNVALAAIGEPGQEAPGQSALLLYD